MAVTPDRSGTDRWPGPVPSRSPQYDRYEAWCKMLELPAAAPAEYEKVCMGLAGWVVGYVAPKAGARGARRNPR